MGVVRTWAGKEGSWWGRGATITLLAGTLAASFSCATPATTPPPAAPAPVAEAPAPEAPEQLPPREIARRASGYTVFVRSGPAYGAGVLFDEHGHVLTCNHVLLDAASVEVRFEGSAAPMTAKIVERDPELDLALLALDGEPPANAVPALSYGLDNIEAIERGDEVYAMGSPRKMRFSFHRGIISFTGRPFDHVFFLQTDLAMNPGSSGGPILNDRGQLIGIAAFILRDGQGLSFALPIDYAFQRFRTLGEEHDREDRVAVFQSWLGKQETADQAPASTSIAKGDAASDLNR